MATDLERLVVQLSADVKGYQNALNRAQGITNRQARAIENRFAKMNSNINSSFRGLLSSSVAGLGGILGTREIIRYADAWTEAGNKIAAAAAIAGVQTRSLTQLKDGANEARTAFGDYVDLYAKLIRSASNVAQSEQEIATATTIVSTAFKAGGASAQEQAAGILQLGQALGSGVLQGDELRSLRENAPVIADAIAKEFGVTLAGLKDLGAEGKLTSDRVFKAILAAQKPIEAAFAATNATIADSFTRLNNEFTTYIGLADNSNGASAKLVEALNLLASNFSETADAVVAFSAVLIGAFTGRAVAGAVVGLGQAVAALGAFLAALRAGTVTAAAFSSALGPVGLLAGAAATAIFLMYDASTAAERAAKAHGEAVNELKFQIENLDYANSAAVASTRTKIASDVEAAKAALERAKAEQSLAASIVRDEVNPAMRNYPSPDATDVENTVSQNPVVKERQQLIDQLDKQLKDLEGINAQFESYASGKAKPTRNTTGFGNGIGATSGKGRSGSTKVDEYERETAQIRARTKALTEETKAQKELDPLVNDYGYTLEFVRAKQDLLNAAQDAGVKITPKLTKSIEGLAAGYANAVVASEQLVEKQDEIRQRAEEAMATAKDVTRGIIDGFVEGASAADILADSLKKIGNALIDDVPNSIFKVNNAAGGGGRFLSGLFSLFGGGGKSSFPSAPGGLFSEGGYTGDGGKYQPAGVVHKGEYVFDQAAVKAAGGPAAMEAMRRNLKGYANGGPVGILVPSVPSLRSMSAQSAGVVVNFNPVVDNRGASVEAVARQEKALAKMQGELQSRVEAAVRSAQKRNVKLG
ncbi:MULTISPECIES: tape measure protein [Rhizobium/Agrobacterium group]|uniref:tape measure protein n=1 Tax=Rhizobium/Agrobacterium group TaxID=227290 RepID=UPI00107F3DA0|nr:MULTISPECIES: tape measure protein [Rhizobium/Agrobacterium group]MBB4402533.1 tape measure domain-containing protein [Agrobacterium radiobacter]MBB5588687.1 tape measure domain-containing protein [Agrobacterium radiobacter]TGE89185.1 phage tail tape measure protein [Rhizobium sp. SEMIA 4032]